MSLNNLLRIFRPKDLVFFNLFENAANNISKMGLEFRAFTFESDPAIRLEIFKRIEKFEDENDNVTHDIFYELGKNFITLIRLREVYTLMEVTTDKFEDVANVVETIIVKYA